MLRSWNWASAWANQTLGCCCQNSGSLSATALTSLFSGMLKTWRLRLQASGSPMWRVRRGQRPRSRGTHFLFPHEAEQNGEGKGRRKRQQNKGCCAARIGDETSISLHQIAYTKIPHFWFTSSTNSYSGIYCICLHKLWSTTRISPTTKCCVSQSKQMTFSNYYHITHAQTNMKIQYMFSVWNENIRHGTRCTLIACTT